MEKNKKKKKNIPDRWEKYSNFGTKIGDSPFIAFKVPLSEKLCRHLPSIDPNESADSEEYWEKWSPKILKESIENLSAIIDLTNTNRYYDPKKDFLSMKHFKIFTEGHVIPSNETVKKFFHAVDEIINSESDPLIGVHCTHGVNRTGYLISRYLIQRLKWNPKDAIDKFTLHRGHPIERKNYLWDLKNPNNWTRIPKVNASTNHNNHQPDRKELPSNSKRPQRRENSESSRKYSKYDYNYERNWRYDGNYHDKDYHRGKNWHHNRERRTRDYYSNNYNYHNDDSIRPEDNNYSNNYYRFNYNQSRTRNRRRYHE